MSPVVSILLCLALLAAAGWWIGWQFARDVALARPLVVDLTASNPAIAPDLKDALRRNSDATIVEIREGSATQVGAAAVRVAQGKILIAHTTPPCTDSLALRTCPMPSNPSEADWDGIAKRVLAHANPPRTASVNTNPHQATQSPEDAYLRNWKIWQVWRNGAVPDTNIPRIHDGIARAARIWPGGAPEERTVLFANLAQLCLDMPEPPTRRLPRLLEGLDAARQALRIGYDLPRDQQVVGLRALHNALQAAIADVDPDYPHPKTGISPQIAANPRS